MKKILLVDDEIDILGSLGNILKSNNYEVSSTMEGKRVMGLAKQIAPDVIILDVLMPDMDGTEVALELEKDPATQDIPVIFLTGMLPKEKELPYKKTNALHYAVAKPVTAEELLQVIETALKGG